MPKPDRQMALIAFMQAQNCSNYVGSWRHPASTPDFLTPDYYQRIARTLEDGRFDLAFFDARLAMPDIYGADHASRSGRYVLHHVLRAVSRGPPVRDDGSDDARTCGVEHRHLPQRFRGGEFWP